MISGWSAHFSPRLIATAQAVWADPIRGDSDLPNGIFIRNGIDMLNRIAVFERGGVPFVHKIRSAQVIISDCAFT
jgi:hypothetical protein